MKEKKSNRAVPYLYYEVEKKRNSKLLPQTKMSPNAHVMKLAQECFWVFPLILKLLYSSWMFSIQDLIKFLSGFQQKIWKSAIRIENLSQHFFYNHFSGRSSDCKSVTFYTTITIFELPNKTLLHKKRLKNLQKCSKKYYLYLHQICKKTLAWFVRLFLYRFSLRW